MTFERMELSPGFNNLDLKTSKTHSKRSSVIIPKEIASKISLKIFDNSNVLQQQEETAKEVKKIY